MPKADPLKEEIGWLKVLGGICAAVDAPLITWLVQNYETEDSALFVCVVFTAGLIASIIIVSVRRVYRCLELLEAL